MQVESATRVFCTTWFSPADCSLIGQNGRGCKGLIKSRQNDVPGSSLHVGLSHCWQRPMAAGVCAGVAVYRRVGALDFGRYLRDPACCRGWAFLRGISSVLGRPPRAHSSTGGRLGCLRGAQPAAWLRRFRQRWRPVMKWMPTSCRLANPQPPATAGSARAFSGPRPSHAFSGLLPAAAFSVMPPHLGGVRPL